MPKYSLADKLKIMFSPEKGKSILDYVYNEILIPTAKNTAYTMCQAAVAKLFDMDPASAPTITTNGHTAYSKVGTVSSTRQPDKASYLPAQSFSHNDISWIAFNTPHDAYKLIEFMKEKMKSELRQCRVSDVYEYLRWNTEIQNTDFDIGWRTMDNICVIERNSKYHVQAPLAKRLS